MNKIDKEKQNKFKAEIIEGLKTNPLVQIISKKVGISRATFYRMKNDDKQFAKSVDEATREGELLINEVAEAQLISAIKDKNLRAVTYWLDKRHPKFKSTLELSGSLEVKNDKLSDEQAEIIKKALMLTVFSKKENNESK